MKNIEPSPLCIGCRKGNVAVVDYLLKNGADAAFVDHDGDTALHIAVERVGLQANPEEYHTIVTLLLQSDAPVNVVSNEGETPLYACIKGLVGVMKQLLDCRDDVGLTTSNSNKYPLLIARERKLRDVAMMLLDWGANANVSKYNETLLKLASSNGDAELVKTLIHYGADVNQMQGISDTALHVAVVRCITSSVCKPNDDGVSLDIVQALLEHGADPNVCPPYDKSSSWSTYFGVYRTLPPLLAASRCGNTELVSLLIKYGAAVGQRTELGRTALHYAIGIDNESSTRSMESNHNNNLIAEMLLSAGANANTMDETGASPLYLACERGKTEIVKLLLSRGANPNMKLKARDRHPVPEACGDHHGKTVLHCILESQFQDVASITVLMQLLLDGGAEVNAASTDGETPFYVACSKGLTSVVAKMLDYGAKVDGHGIRSPLNVACRNKHMPVVQLLLSNGANPNILEVDAYRCRRTLPLHIAAANGSSELTELLLKHGSNIDVADASGNTALHHGIKNYHTSATAPPTSEEIKASSNAKSVVDILLENKADVNILNDSGETPLYTAVSSGLLDVVSEMLQTYGGNTNIPSPDKNALVAACVADSVELVDMLLKNGADPNLASVSCHPYSKCRLPLCTAVTEDRPNSDEIVVLLIKAGANVNAINSEGKSALCVATENVTNSYLYQSSEVRKKLISTIRVLLEDGADVNMLMPDGRSLLCLVVSTIAGTQRRNSQTHFIELLQLMAKHGAIISDSFSLLGLNTSRQLGLHGTLRDLATFDGKHEFIVDLFRAGVGFHLIAVCCNAVSRSKRARSIRLCQAAVIAGYSPSPAEMQQLQLAATSEDVSGGVLDQLMNWLNEDRQQVPSLSRQCRVVIRQQLSLAVNHRSILTAIDTLPLPNSMKMYLKNS